MRLLVVLGILAYSVPSLADTLDRTAIKNVLENLNPIELNNNGNEGIWFPKDEAEKILYILGSQLPLALDIIDSQTNQAKILNQAIDLYKSSMDGYMQQASLNTQMLDISLQFAKEFQQPQYAWYEGRIAVYVYGILTAVAVIFTSAYILDLIQP